MKVLCTSGTRDGGGVIQPQPPADSNVNPPGSLIHKTRHRFSASNYVRFASGGQHTLAPRGNDILKRLLLGHGTVKRPIKGHLEWACHLNKMTRLLDIDSAVRAEQTYNHSTDSNRTGILQIFPHYFH